MRLTLDPRAQKAAYDGLAGRTGAVVALDPRTGAILAMASSPSLPPETSINSPVSVPMMLMSAWALESSL